MGYFEKTYWNAMDKESVANYMISPAVLGIATPPFEKQLDALKARIFQGAPNVELGFMGQGKGSISGGNITPEMHSKMEREEMRALAKINKVGLTTHASANVMGLAGLSQGGVFNETAQEHGINEIKRAIDFAADVTDGGPVVVHTGEFSRPIYGSSKDKWKDQFRAYPKEEEKLTHYIVEKKTGKVYEGVREDETIAVPEYTDVERLNPDGTPMTSYNIFTKKEEPVYEIKTDPNGAIQVKMMKYEEFKEEVMKKEGIPEENVPLRFFWELRKREMEREEGQAHEYEIRYRETQEAIKGLRKLREVYKKWEDASSPEGKEALKQKATTEVQKYLQSAGGLRSAEPLGSPDDFKTPTEIIDRAIWVASKQMAYGLETATGARRQLAKSNEMVQEAQLIDNYALEKSEDSFARLGMYAYDKEKKQGLKKPLFIAAENVFAEQYGSHPDELKEIVVKSREKMKDMLIEKEKMSAGEAQKVADDHIRATLDIGHLNTWWKYFKGTPEEFKTWILEKTKDLMKNNIIGHIHVSDNFGYEDEHISPGEGNAPIKEFIEELKKQGYKDRFIVETGAQDKGRTWEALNAAMKSFTSPIYEIDGEAVGWGKVEHSYFGRVPAGPRYVIGAYAPDIDIPTENRTWTFWSGVPME